MRPPDISGGLAFFISLCYNIINYNFIYFNNAIRQGGYIMKRRAIDFFCTFLSYLVIIGVPIVFVSFALSIFHLIPADLAYWKVMLIVIVSTALSIAYGYEVGIEVGYKKGHHERYQIGCEIERNVQLQSSKTT